MKKIFLAILAFTILSSCGQKRTIKSHYIMPFDAIQMAASASESGTSVKGTFSLLVKAVGSQGTTSYVNSELDYRDQRNLSIVIPNIVKLQLIEKYKVNFKSIFMGKNILIDGEAKRVKITISANGRRTSKYYYQTHVRVDNIDQIQIR